MQNLAWPTPPVTGGPKGLSGSPIPLRIRLLFWLLLGALSVFFAEIVSGSSSYAFFTAWGLLAVLPLYGLHALFLAWLVFRPQRRVTLSALFLAGAMFGLYEAYITKVLWDPTWGSHGLNLGGLYVTQTAVLVLYWHPLMAFIVPVVVGETLFTSSRESLRALPRWLQGGRGEAVRRAWLPAAFGAFCGISKALNARSPLEGLFSAASGVGVLLVLAVLWRRTGCSLARFRDLLPSRREAMVLGVLLGLLYVVMGVGIRPEALPRALVPHLSVWLMYLLLIGLFLREPRHSRSGSLEVDAEPPSQVRLRPVMVFLVSFGLTLVLATSVKSITTVAVLLTWAAGCAAGAFLLAQAVWIAFPLRRPG